MKKRLLALFLTCIMALGITACGGSTTSSEDTSEPPPPPLSEEDIPKMYANPEQYVGSSVTLTGQIFGGVEYDDDAQYFQMWGDPDNRDWNTVVGYPYPEVDLEDEQYIRIQGVVADVFEGENMMGGTIIAPAIRADSVEVLSYKDAVRPTIATATPATSTIDQYGYSITVEKVELAEKETRVYVSATNNGSDEFHVSDYNMLIIQGNTQYEYELNFEGDYPELQSPIRPGVTTSGVVTFPPIEQAPFQLFVEGNNFNWEQELDEYVFDLSFE